MALRLADKSQRGLAFAIIDEVDSILIDEARTPLIISGAAQDSSSLYRSVNKLVQKLDGGTEEGTVTLVWMRKPALWSLPKRASRKLRKY